MKKAVPLALLVLAVLPAVAPAPASAQRRPDAPPPVPFLVAGRVGFDTRTTEDPILGAMVRIPVPIPIPGRVALQAAGDLTFLDGLTERQLALDLVYDLRGLTLAGGPVFRNSIWRDPNAGPGSALTGDRDTRTGSRTGDNGLPDRHPEEP